MNLILFSGGVESTALLQKVTSTDLVVTLRSPYSAVCDTFTPYADNILNHYCLTRTYISADIPSKQMAVHQLKYFTPFIILLWNTYRFDKVLIGRCKEDITDGVLKMVDDAQNALNILCPGVIIDHPLDHLRKQEQWNMIPKQIRGYVSSCVTHNNCGECRKCKEKNSLILQKDL